VAARMSFELRQNFGVDRRRKGRNLRDDGLAERCADPFRAASQDGGRLGHDAELAELLKRLAQRLSIGLWHAGDCEVFTMTSRS
jgi:hypothetical protein